MADLTDIQAAESVKIVGSSSTGVEGVPIQSSGNGALHTNIRNDSGVEIASSTSMPSSNALGLVVRPLSIESPTYCAVAENVVVGNNKSLLAIQNTGTSVIRIREIWVINDRTTAVTGVAGDFRFLRINSFTNGTSVTASTYDTDDVLPSGITLSTGATVSGESALLRLGTWSTDEWGPGTLDQEGMDHGLQQIEPFWKQTPNGKAITLRQNQGAHLKFSTNSTAGTFNIRIIFTTES